MQYDDQPQQYTQTATLNRAIPDADVINLRLDTTKVITELQMLLLGINETIGVENGKLVKKIEKTGSKRVNQYGLQCIMSRTKALVNSMTVQGNMKEDDYWRFISNYHEWLYRDLWLNMYEYGIDENQFESVISDILSLVIPFMSRTIDNLERKSYGESMKSTDTSYQQKKKNGLLASLFG